VSRSPRRKALKALRLERKQVRREGDAYRAQLLRQMNDWLEMHMAELREVRETFAPQLERLISVRIGMPHKVAVPHTIPRHRGIDSAPAVAEVFSTYDLDTRELLRLCIDMPRELILYLFNKDAESWRIAERELQHAATRLVRELMKMAFTGRLEQ